jgi:hypothetical protein
MDIKRIYEMGNILGLEKREIKDLISNKPTAEITVAISSSVELYKLGALYGTITISDF